MSINTLKFVAVFGLVLSGCATEAPVLHPIAHHKIESSVDAVDLKYVDTPPAAIAMKRPIYPSDLRGRRVNGSATMLVVVLKDGTVGEVEAIEASDKRFADAAQDAVRQWRFRPALKSGIATNCRMTIPMNFAVTD